MVQLKSILNNAKARIHNFLGNASIASKFSPGISKGMTYAKGAANASTSAISGAGFAVGSMAAQKTKETIGANAPIFIGIILYLFDIMTGYNGAGWPPITDIKGIFLNLFTAIILITYFLITPKESPKQFTSGIILIAITIFSLFNAWGIGTILHILFIVIIIGRLMSQVFEDKVQLYVTLSILILFDIFGYSLLGYYSIAQITRFIFPFILYLTILFAYSTKRNALTYIMMVVIIFLNINSILVAFPSAKDADIADQSIINQNKEQIIKAAKNLQENFYSLTDIVACNLGAYREEPEACIEKRKVGRLPPEEQEKINSQKDAEKTPTKIYFKTESGQTIPQNGMIGIDSELYVQSDQPLEIDISCEIKKGNEIIYEGPAFPEKYPLNQIGTSSPRHITVTCRNSKPFENYGRDYSTKFKAEIKKDSSDIYLQRVIISNEKWIEDFSKSPYSKNPYNYNKEESPRAGEQLAGIIFKIGSETLMYSEGFYKLSGYFTNLGNGKINSISLAKFVLNNKYIIPGEECKEFYIYNQAENTLTLKDSLIPFSSTIEKIRKGDKSSPIPQCSIEIDPQAKNEIPNMGGEVFDITSIMEYGYQEESNNIRFNVESGMI